MLVCVIIIQRYLKERELSLAGKVISVYHRKYAVELFWQPVGIGGTVRNYARSLARGVDKKLNLYTEYRAMIGLGASKNGQHVGMLSAAAEVMESFSEYTSFLAVFDVDKKFYMVAARNGIILHDKLFDSEEDARQEYVELSKIPDWGAFFAPGAWGMPRAAERNLADLLTGRSHATLHSISRFRSGVFSFGLVVLFLLGLGLVFSDSLVQVFSPRPQVQKLDPELVAEYKRQIEEKSKELDAQYEIEKVAPPEPIVFPYEMLPDVQARAYQCYQAIGFLMQPVLGWNQVFVDCGETHADADFRRGFGTLGDFYSVAPVLMPGGFFQEANEESINVRVALPKLETFASQDERDAETIVRELTTLFQDVDMDAEIQVVVDTLTNGVDVANVVAVEVGAASKLVPMQFMEIFGDFDGVNLLRVSWNVASRLWNYEVKIYAK